jgi:hypothetical protein
MTAAADIVAGLQHAVASLGVPWWGWTALAVMIFFGLLVPKPLTADEAKIARQREELADFQRRG